MFGKKEKPKELKKTTDYTEADLQIDTAFCGRIEKVINALQGRIGLNIKVHAQDDILQKGQIFLFNHFARFETIIPPYVIQRETGAYSRSVAHHSLFAGEKLSSIMRRVGCVPSNLPGLLPFLAAEILRGKKVMIFPEGGMVKDRRVIDDKGDYNIFSPSARARRKHHRGAAALALTLELFKKRIRSLYEDGDFERLERWRLALKIPSVEALLEQAKKPTFVVPSTITFFPVRIDDSVLSRLAERINSKMPAKALEELAIEGNLLFKNTDMDIRMNKPIVPHMKWHFWEKLLLKQYFEEIDSLDEFFGLREKGETWTEKLLAKVIARETDRLRDGYMKAIYTGITVNLTHLASVLMTELLDRDVRHITFSDFHRTLYLTVKALQNEPDVYLHRALVWPERYDGLRESVSPDLERFMKSCQDAGLVRIGNHGYELLDKLKDEHDFHEVRLKNPVLVTANEVAPIKPVGTHIASSLDHLPKLTKTEMAGHMYDDEQRTHTWNQNYFKRPEYKDINNREKAQLPANPYLNIPKGGADVGVLLVHGFLASPAEMAPLADFLTQQGYATMGVRLAGHGTSPWDLNGRSWPDWLQSVQRGYQILAPHVEKVIVVGFSMGGDLSLLFTAHKPEKLAGLISVCAPTAVQDKNLAFVPLLHGLNKLASYIPRLDDGISLFRPSSPENPDINYHSMPVHALNELRKLMKVVHKNLKRIELPTLIIQATQDPVVRPESGQKIFDAISSQDKTLHWVKSKRHALIFDNIGNTYTTILSFIKRIEATATPIKNAPSGQAESQKENKGAA